MGGLLYSRLPSPAWGNTRLVLLIGQLHLGGSTTGFDRLLPLPWPQICLWCVSCLSGPWPPGIHEASLRATGWAGHQLTARKHYTSMSLQRHTECVTLAFGGRSSMLSLILFQRSVIPITLTTQPLILRKETSTRVTRAQTLKTKRTRAACTTLYVCK